MTTHLIINRQARDLARNSALADRLARYLGAGQTFSCNSLADLTAAAEAIAASGSDLVMLCGGDGSLMRGISALDRACDGWLPVIAPVPAGTVCTIARAWGVSGDPDELVPALLGDQVQVTTQASLRLRVESLDGVAVDQVGFIFGLGLVTNFFEQYEARGARGPADAARIAIRTFLSSLYGGDAAHAVLKPQHCRVVVDGQRLPTEAWSLLCCAAIDNLGLGMRLTYRGGWDPHRPHLVGSGLSPTALGPQVFRVLAARALRDPTGIDARMRTTELCMDSGGSYILDGDRFEARRITISAGPIIRVAQVR